MKVFWFLMAMFCATTAYAETTDNLTMKHINKVYKEAVSRWKDAGYDVKPLKRVKFKIYKELKSPEWYNPPNIKILAFCHGELIEIDNDAIDGEWYVDDEPWNDDEYDLVNGQQVAKKGEAKGRMDLLSVVAHELGHTLGLSHDYRTIMTPKISNSKRHLRVRKDKRAKH